MCNYSAIVFTSPLGLLHTFSSSILSLSLAICFRQIGLSQATSTTCRYGCQNRKYKCLWNDGGREQNSNSNTRFFNCGNSKKLFPYTIGILGVMT